jgi:hypothetical protein
VRAESGRPRGYARRTAFRAVYAVVLGAASVAFAATPAAAASGGGGNDRPHAVSTSAPHGHGQGHGSTHKASHSTKPGQGSTSIAKPRARTSPAASPTAAPSAGHQGYDGYDAPSPAPASAPAARATPKPTTAPAPDRGVSTWQREDQTQSNRGVVRAFATDLKKASQSAGFPALLIAVMAVFLLVQHRLDRRDVKLSLADWATDQGLEFSAPTTIQPHATTQS